MLDSKDFKEWTVRCYYGVASFRSVQFLMLRNVDLLSTYPSIIITSMHHSTNNCGVSSWARIRAQIATSESAKCVDCYR